MPQPKRVVHLSTLHSPGDPRIFWKEARSLAQKGYEVHLFLPGEVEGIREGVHCHPLTPGRIRRMGVPGFSRLLRLLEAFQKTLKIKPDLFHFHDPELIPVAILLKFLLRIPIIYDVHEDAPQEARTFHKHRPLYAFILSRFYAFLELLARLTFDAFVTATPAISKKFPSGKTITVANYPPLTLFPEGKIATEKRNPWIIYAGLITPVRSAVEMVQAMEHVSDPRASLILLGPVRPPELLETLKKEPGFKRVEYLGHLPYEKSWEVLFQARIGLLLYSPATDHLTALPNKMFEYMMAGLAIIASNFPYWEEILSQTGAGLCADPRNPVEIASKISWLLDHPEEMETMGKRGQKAVREEFRWEKEEEKLHILYLHLLNKN